MRVRSVGTLLKETWGVKVGRAHERGTPHTLKPKSQRFLLGKTSIPLGGHNFLVRRRCKGLEKVGRVMLCLGGLSLTFIPSFYVL